MKKFLIIINTLIATTATLLAAGPGEGQITSNGDGKISKLEVKYNISQLMGEPTVYISYKWHGYRATKSLPPNTIVWLKVVPNWARENNGKIYAYIRHDPSVPKEGEWADEVAGSPSWDHVLFTARSNKHSYTAKAAKEFWDKGFRVVEASLEYGE
jgi:hypothetical protein